MGWLSSGGPLEGCWCYVCRDMRHTTLLDALVHSLHEIYTSTERHGIRLHIMNDLPTNIAPVALQWASGGQPPHGGQLTLTIQTFLYCSISLPGQESGGGGQGGHLITYSSPPVGLWWTLLGLAQGRLAATIQKVTLGWKPTLWHWSRQGGSFRLACGGQNHWSGTT